MPRYDKVEKDIIQSLQRDIEKLERRVKHLENPHHTTLHEFPKASMPPLIDGLICIATDNTFVWVRNGVPRSVSGTAF